MLTSVISSVSFGFGHIYWRNPQWKTSFFVQWFHFHVLTYMTCTWNFSSHAITPIVTLEQLRYLLLILFETLIWFIVHGIMIFNGMNGKLFQKWLKSRWRRKICKVHLKPYPCDWTTRELTISTTAYIREILLANVSLYVVSFFDIWKILHE